MPYPNPKHMKSDLARARGLGSAMTGTHHWWMVQASAAILTPLSLWFFFSMLHLVATNTDYTMALEWIKKPYNALLMIFFLGMNFYHAGISGQEIIIDYVPNHKVQIPAALIYRMVCFALGILSVFSVLYICFKL